MASWQCDFHLVPRGELRTGSGGLPEFIASGRARETRWWRRSRLPADYRERLGALAAPGHSWSHDLQTWGREEGSRVDVWSEQGRVQSVFARVDVRAPDRRFVGGLADFARAADAVLVRYDGLVVEPTLPEVEAALGSSRAARFVEDPEAYLTRVRLGGLEDG